MTIDWGALAAVAVVSFAVAVLVVVLASLALVGLSARELGPTGEATYEIPVIGRPHDKGLSPAMGTAMAALCLLGAAAIVLYGFSLLVF